MSFTTNLPVHLSKSERRRVIAGSLARSAAGLLVISFVLSLVPERPDRTMAIPLVMMVLLSWAYVWYLRRELRAIRVARMPLLYAGEAGLQAVALFLAIFAAFYATISVTDQGAFSEPLNHFSGYYFALTVLATVGFGDITPVTTVARSFTMVQMALDLVFVAVVVKVILATAQETIAHRDAAANAPVRPEPTEG